MEIEVIGIVFLSIPILMILRFFLLFLFRRKMGINRKTIIDFYQHLFSIASIVECFLVIPYNFKLKNRKTIYIDIISYLIYLLTFIFILLLLIDSM